MYTPPSDRERTQLNSSHAQIFYSVFFFNDTATTEIYTLSLHDALPILMIMIMAVFCILTVNTLELKMQNCTLLLQGKYLCTWQPVERKQQELLDNILMV